MELAARQNPIKLTALVALGLLIASSWLVFPYFVQGTQLLRGVGDNARAVKAGSVSRYLTRELAYSREFELTATFASDEYFQYVDQANIVASLRPDRNYVFYVSETVHVGELPAAVPQASLRVGDREHLPVVAEGPRNARHHRVTAYSFAKRTISGERIDIESAGRMRLFVSGRYLGSERPLTFVGAWDAPYGLPEDLKARAGITPIAVLALGAGLLSAVLTPCLLQLVVMFGGVLAGFATVPGTAAPALAEAAVRRKVMQIALAFVTGFIVLYMLAGAAIGSIGHQSQLFFSEYSRSIAVASGAIVMSLAGWVAWRGHPMCRCRLPGQALLASRSRGDTVATVIASAGYALGCTACFGGAIVATLLVYVGNIGSAMVGAGIMLTFAIGVAVPFLLAAYYISRSEPIVRLLAGNSRALSYVGAAVIAAFGLILITDNFHTVSDLIYPYLGLG